jgi:hypothetical protein
MQTGGFIDIAIKKYDFSQANFEEAPRRLFST